MKIYLSLIILTLFFSNILLAQNQKISGFRDSAASVELRTEQKFDQSLNAAEIGKTIQELSQKPHHIGSIGGKEVAENILQKFKNFGFDAQIETYQVLFPTPKTRILEMTGPTTFSPLLKELALNEDISSGQDGQLPLYNAWSADGDVTGELVYVNFGLPEDYEKLDELGISVKGKIVIARYGKSWRGIKPKVAQEHGAIGCIIYSDPNEDGYHMGDVYPKGPYKNEFGGQRGSIMDMVIYPGDPLTPGVGATKNAKRLERSQAQNLLKIPVIPISYHDALPLLSSLEGPVAPTEDWRGALPITYHIGPGKTTVHIKLEFNWNMVPAYDVIAKIKGSEFPDEWIVRGNHHDAWVNGANDPISGQSAMLEEAKSIGNLLKSGWRPKRTLVYCAWDGEEPGLIGSTEWAEDHARELQEKAVIYINSDGNGRGFLGAEGSQALEKFVTEVAQNVIDPQTQVSVFDRQKAQEIVGAPNLKIQKEIRDEKTLKLGALGSGSDFSSFLQHLGIPTLNLGFGGEDPGGEYHSIYDTYLDYSKFKDPGFSYGVSLASTAGRTVLRMADAEILPFDYRSLYKTIQKYSLELIELTSQLRDKTASENLFIREDYYKLAADPTLHKKPKVESSEVPYLDFSPLQNSLRNLEISTGKLYQTSLDNLNSKPNENFNKKLFHAEQELLSKEGLPRRGWYKHVLYAPGFYTGYGVKTLPGIREAIEQRNWIEAQEQIQKAAQRIQALSDYISKP